MDITLPGISLNVSNIVRLGSLISESIDDDDESQRYQDEYRLALLDFTDSAIPLLQAAGWENVKNRDDIIIAPLSGAMTNLIFCCSTTGKGTDQMENKLLLRVFGEGTETFFSRDEESSLFQNLSHFSEIQPKIVKSFRNGRIEVFLDGYQVLTAEKIRQKIIVTEIATKMLEFHKLQVDAPGRDGENYLWNLLFRWLKHAKTLCQNDDANEARFAKVNLTDLETEINWLENMIPKFIDSPIVFGHNDLQYGNIMISVTGAKICFIDFEYSGYVPRGYDIANYFAEWAADYHNEIAPHALNYDTKYPTKEERYHFYQSYDDKVAPEKLEQEVMAYALVNHMVWGIWGLIQAAKSNIDFDFLEYGMQRFLQYRVEKERYVS
mmetsp:Transcript_42909/g.48748  ORF Transcript_42909/g.48748 Transcript_42909/m.48748 type:complete len:380 (+) Transcript_42909:45-1184(+)|eukprot:CAMPEP_0194139576 /NCGR_PEP_ID=MMETSP0152-20130528/9209_1 /TAXON_ID=1049557 /ORGANISM="Thalassiothrix antarctica, Strain L6-D1" /LENGTH=379 /DNA_ID=CAMNT_0038837473 /DNA_START=23 /DNA_END=1162 /DNA_ORIENTATION=-